MRIETSRSMLRIVASTMAPIVRFNNDAVSHPAAISSDCPLCPFMRGVPAGLVVDHIEVVELVFGADDYASFIGTCIVRHGWINRDDDSLNANPGPVASSPPASI